MVLCPDDYWPPYLAREATGLKYTGSGAPALPTGFLARETSVLKYSGNAAPALPTGSGNECRKRCRVGDRIMEDNTRLHHAGDGGTQRAGRP